MISNMISYINYDIIKYEKKRMILLNIMISYMISLNFYDIIQISTISYMISYMISYKKLWYHIWYHSSAFLALYDIIHNSMISYMISCFFYDIMYDIIKTRNILPFLRYQTVWYGYDIIPISYNIIYDIKNLWYQLHLSNVFASDMALYWPWYQELMIS